jgi:hypothetical protein
VTEAIFGLIGVVVGGVLTFGTDWLSRHVERRRARRLAARVMIDELAWFVGTMGMAVDVDDVRMLASGEDVHSAWREHQPALTELPTADWDTVHKVVLLAANLRASLVKSEETPHGAASLQADHEAISEAFKRAHEALNPHR